MIEAALSTVELFVRVHLGARWTLNSATGMLFFSLCIANTACGSHSEYHNSIFKIVLSSDTGFDTIESNSFNLCVHRESSLLASKSLEVHPRSRLIKDHNTHPCKNKGTLADHEAVVAPTALKCMQMQRCSTVGLQQTGVRTVEPV